MPVNAPPSRLSTGGPVWDIFGNVSINSLGVNTGNFYVNGSLAFACRAWVNFNGASGPVAVRASGNVSSLTDNGTGDYTVNFTTPMVDTNYCITTSSSYTNTVTNTGNNGNPSSHPISTTACRVFCSDGFLTDMQTVSAAIFR